ncbi:hypothetical protein [Bradyrhizobium lablabi]|uniref:hypothetical protein n=1 Tax=Bradyrhizobium lablabi TaxID=722472 RepID=UPI001BAAFFDA|nr:hypothetical protein [Bradyrhizobium lablabi]MBR0696684.1 hypothetical protein [Bradyrhizobium lablabi]
MTTCPHPIATPALIANAGSNRMTYAKAVAFEAIQSVSGVARTALFVYAMTGSAIASLAVIAAPHLEMLLRCIFQGRG